MLTGSAGAPAPDGASYQRFLASRPRDAENAAVAQVIELARRTGCRVHILHVSSADVLPLLAEARESGLRITAETCPHYLTFAAEEIPDGATQYKCCPPIRETANRDLLWEGLRDGLIDLVVSDHSPSTVDLKLLDTGDFGAAWGGIASLQARPAGRVDAGTRTRLHSRRRRPLDVPSARNADRVVAQGQARDSGTTRTSASSRPMKHLWWMSTRCTTRTPSRRTPDGHSPA